jgi:hypothetical protein
MYNWRTSPYVVLYFHRGEPAEEDAKVNQLITDMYEAEPPANVILEPVNLDEEKALEGYPEPVKEAFEAHAEKELPLHMVMTPWLAELHAGRLTEAEVKAMVDSPLRTRLGELIDEGNAAVMVFVPGKDEAANQKAREVVKELIDQAATGDMFPDYFSDPAGFDPGPPTEDSEGEAEEATAEGSEGEAEKAAAEGSEAEADDDTADESEDVADEETADDSGGLKLAMVEVSRTDKAEAWLVRSLMTAEPDLAEYADEPMVFAVYGRGRAMPPYIGKGITVELLTDVLAFLVGPCSCFAKAENPGMDLLARWDWEATADKMAANDPSLYPDAMMYEEFAVDDAEETSSETEVSTEDVSPEPAEATETGGEELAAATDAVAAVPEEEMPAAEPAPGETTETVPDVEEAEQAPEETTDTVPEAEEAEPAEVEEPAELQVDSVETPAGLPVDSGDSAESFTSGITWRLALGLALGAVAVVVAGFVLIRKH